MDLEFCVPVVLLTKNKFICFPRGFLCEIPSSDSVPESHQQYQLQLIDSCT